MGSLILDVLLALEMYFKTDVLSDQNTDMFVGDGSSALSILSTLTENVSMELLLPCPSRMLHGPFLQY